MSDLLRFFRFYGNNLALWADNFICFPCILLKSVLCMLLIASSRKCSKMAENNSKWPIYCDFLQIISIILLCKSDLTSIFFLASCSNLYCMGLITSSRTFSVMAAGYCRVCYCFKLFSLSQLSKYAGQCGPQKQQWSLDIPQ